MLAQSDGTNRIYFQYNGDNPIGFELNDTQYYYVTNTNGDIVGITDANGNLIATYTYDEWGKLLSIIPTDNENEDNAEAQLSIAEINPLRYRGYYYDSESGMYYLQTRYYNPELCRFISADSFDYINTDTPMSVNAYAYCINNPLLYSDPTGKAYVSEAGNVVAVVITEIFVCLDLQEIVRSLKIEWDIDVDFSFNNLDEYMQKKVEIYTIWFDHKIWTASTDFANTLAGYVSTVGSLIPCANSKITAALITLPYVTSALKDFSGRYISPKGGLFMMVYDLSTNLASSLLGKNTSLENPILETITSTAFGKIFEIFGYQAAMNYAYNWYLMK